jgi:hypothetical protein
MFTFCDPQVSNLIVRLPLFKTFLSLVLKSIAAQRNLKWRFHYIIRWHLKVRIFGVRKVVQVIHWYEVAY